MAAAPSSSSSRLRVMGGLAAMAFVVHGGNHVRRGSPYDLLWMCNVAPILLAAGCFFAKPDLAAIAALWLAFGTPMWLLDIATGSGIILTSFLPHVLCPVVAVLAVREMGLARRAWLKATAALLALVGLTRALTPPGPNVNLSHRVWAGWEAAFPRYDRYFALVAAAAALTFFVLDRALAAWLGRSRPGAADGMTPGASTT
ncbi:hypothetical protein [Sorangium cellulosum]|uniref:Uncharacterized protein n=1 Tax=Sorangium cellulosum TaxID=56 RepID=A0A150QWL5_SORCE|nr:hypothetical protein [Sorangium cellulosum]KYF72427.1 hypothetical protein BE15_48070 [Sorangium cellulosum]